MDLSVGRVIFFAIFILVFIVVMVLTYRKDMKKSPDLFKGAWKLVLAFVVLITLYMIVTRIAL